MKEKHTQRGRLWVDIKTPLSAFFLSSNSEMEREEKWSKSLPFYLTLTEQKKKKKTKLKPETTGAGKANEKEKETKRKELRPTTEMRRGSLLFLYLYTILFCFFSAEITKIWISSISLIK